MWTPDYYNVTDNKTILDFIKEIGLGILISYDGQYPIATHAPIEYETDSSGKSYLRGHIAKINPHSKILKNCAETLVIFQSPISHYISSSWYEAPNAPTWNYMSIHIYGKLTITKGEALYQSVKRLTDRHEKISKCPVSLDTLPKNIQSMLSGVTGFEIEIEKIETSFKLSQNRNDKDYKNIITELSLLDTPLSKLMANQLDKTRGI